MTLEELKQALDTYVGLPSQMENAGDGNAKLVYRSSTGLRLFDFTIGNYGDGWQFSGHSNALPGNWEVLCQIHQEVKQDA